METERIATPVVHMLYLTYAETTPDLGYDSNGGQRLQKMVATGSGGLEEHMARFTLPRDLYHGKGALEALKDFEGKRAMICVGGGSMKRFGFLDRAKQYLEEAGMEVCLFEGIEPDPSVETVMKGAKAMEEFKPDWIVAMGGGSPIDAAKAMWIKYEYPDITFEDMCKVFGIPKLRKKAHFCAISSTSGTATEVTAFSIITGQASSKLTRSIFRSATKDQENFRLSTPAENRKKEECVPRKEACLMRKFACRQP